MIKFVVFDFDGVFTNGNIVINDNNKVIKHYNVKDGMGIKLIMYTGTITTMFFIPSDVFIYLTTWPFKIGGASFIMLQIMFLISFIYDIYEGLV